MTHTFAIDPNAPPEEIEAVHAGLREYNRQFTSFEGASPLNIFLRDEHGALAGGLLGYVCWGWLYVEILWLAEAVRGQDYGSRLLDLAEQEAARRGCRHANLDTMSFQALPFYIKRGYTVWGQLDDFPVGHSRIFLKKDLA
jgi:GNAT superfamily N-acetyltransferase